MNIRKLFDFVLFYISVPKCVCCREKLDFDDGPLCKKCIIEYREHKMKNCSICAKPYSRCSCTMKYLDSHYLHKMIKVYRYLNQADIPSNKLIFSLKRESRSDVSDFLASELCDAITASVKNPSEYIITNVPRRRGNVNKYGTDHAAKVAKKVAKLLSAEYYQPIISKNKLDQKKLSGEDRLSNTNYEVRKKARDLSGKRVIIIDDIVTTGASISSCAMLIKSLGVRTVIGASISIAYKDSYTPFSNENRFYNEGKGI